MRVKYIADAMNCSIGIVGQAFSLKIIGNYCGFAQGNVAYSHNHTNGIVRKCFVCQTLVATVILASDNLNVKHAISLDVRKETFIPLPAHVLRFLSGPPVTLPA